MNWWWRLVRFGFHLLYNDLAFTYDLISKAVSLGAWRCWQRSALKHLAPDPHQRILEVAHGTGDLQLDLQAAGYQVVGCDLSPQMGSIARSKLLRHQKVLRLIRGRAQALPFVTGGFDAVIATFPSDFIVDPETLNEIHRVLVPGGRLIIVYGAVLTGGGAVRTFLEWLYKITGQREAGSADMAAYFEPFGFAVRIIQELCPRSTAQLIVATRDSVEIRARKSKTGML